MTVNWLTNRNHCSPAAPNQSRATAPASARRFWNELTLRLDRKEGRSEMANLFPQKTQPAFMRLAAAMKFSVAVEMVSLRYAMPTTKGGGGGVSGRTFNRGPVKQSKS